MTRWNHNNTLLAALTTLTVALAGCRGDDPPGSSATESGSTSDASSSTGSESGTSTSGAPETSSSTTDPSTTEASAGFLTTQGSSGGMTLPNGAQCELDEECESMKCYLVPQFGGVCSECKSDSDCIDSGDGISCSLDGVSMQAKCTEGGLGTTCESQDSCADGLICDEVIPGTFGVVPTACGECGDSDDCDGELLCSPKIDFAMLSGYKSCVEPGSVPNNELCPNNAEGDDVCMSGKCGEVSVMAIIQLGVCGECISDDDCMGGTCTPGSFDGGGVMGSVCAN